MIESKREPSRLRFSGFRIGFYVFSFVWIALVPVFNQQASHFGWGFFPMLASIFVVPVILFGLAGDLMVRAIDAATLEDESGLARLYSVGVPLLLLAGSGLWLYYLFNS